MTKYKEYFKKMVEANKDIFTSFQKLHANYELDQDKWQEEFNQEGEKILAIVREWENKLCTQSEKAGFSSFTGNLAEKFQAEVKSHFPLIDHVGLLVKPFSLKEIKLS